MNTLMQLWLPIVATAVLIFVASSLIHMVFKWHNSDYKALPNEDAARAAIGGAVPPGQYMIPHCTDMKEMGSEAMMKKFADGPVAFVTMRKNGPPAIHVALGMWFVFTLVIAALAACLALQAYALDGPVNQAAQLIGFISFIAYSAGSVQYGIWMGKPWGSVAKDFLDAFIYAVISALTFMWLWPAA